MRDSDTGTSNDHLAHDAAVEEFVDRVSDANLAGVDRLILFGSVARTNHSPDSDIDVLAVVDTAADVHHVEERLRDIAYDTMLERGVVFSIHAVSTTTFEQRADHPFFQTVADEGRPIYG